MMIILLTASFLCAVSGVSEQGKGEQAPALQSVSLF